MIGAVATISVVEGKEKEEISKRFYQGDSPDKLSEEFKCVKLTIARILKKKLTLGGTN